MSVSPPPIGSRLSCGALKKDSFPNLRAPSGSDLLGSTRSESENASTNLPGVSRVAVGLTTPFLPWLGDWDSDSVPSLATKWTRCTCGEVTLSTEGELCTGD